MTFARSVQPEWLDHLPASDPRAIRSRGDLRRINRLMATTTLLGNALDPLLVGRERAHLVELGAGDGNVMLRLARVRAKRWPLVRLGLLDLQPVVTPAVLEGYRALDWTPELIQADVFDWLADGSGMSFSNDAPIIVANLFLHHFDDPRLAELLQGIASRASAFVCLEPRRSPTALLGSRLLGVIGCNDVTRHDAVVSVRAGFRDGELSALWPSVGGWCLAEGAAGMFNHRFVAVRT